jgi:hypothetical protein
MTTTEVKTPTNTGKHLSKLWVPLVLLIGVVLGEALSSSVPVVVRTRFGIFPLEPGLRTHVILTTIEVVLLLALIVVYLRFYSQTRANFALGLVFVLVALFLNSFFSHPFLESLVGPVPFGLGFYVPFADIFTIAAYTVFLYLSLE